MAVEDELASDSTGSGANDTAEPQVDAAGSDASDTVCPANDLEDSDSEEDVAQCMADDDKGPAEAKAPKNSDTSDLSAPGSSDVNIAPVEPSVSAASSGVDDGAADDGELDDESGEDGHLTGLVPSTKTFDRHVKDLISGRPRSYLYFDQWTWSRNESRRLGAVKQLRLAFEALLPRVSSAPAMRVRSVNVGCSC
jgi:hypothetical protein